MKGPVTWNENGEMVPLSDEVREAWAGQPAVEEEDARVLKVSRGRLLLRIFDQMCRMSLGVVAGLIVGLIGMALVMVVVPTLPLKIIVLLGIAGLIVRRMSK